MCGQFCGAPASSPGKLFNPRIAVISAMSKRQCLTRIAPLRQGSSSVLSFHAGDTFREPSNCSLCGFIFIPLHQGDRYNLIAPLVVHQVKFDISRAPKIHEATKLIRVKLKSIQIAKITDTSRHRFNLEFFSKQSREVLPCPSGLINVRSHLVTSTSDKF
jgi:hypothetical protein